MSARTGLPLEQLEALEGGTVDRIPDRVVILKTLRGYADFLGLSGDRFVLTLIEHWPMTPSAHRPIVAVQGTTGVVPMSGPPTAMVPNITTPTTAVGGVHSGTAQVPVVRADAAPLDTGSLSLPATGAVSGVIADTGVTAAVPGVRRRTPGRHRTGPPVGLRVLVVFLALAVLVGVAGLLVHKFRPSWLQTIGITHPQQSATTTTAATSRHTHTSTPTTVAKQAVFKIASTTPTSATFDVSATSFAVQVVAVGNASWVQANAPSQTTPLYSGILQSGQSKSFVVQHSLTMQIGSAAAHVFVSVGKQNVGFYVPSVAPFTMNFQAVS